MGRDFAPIPGGLGSDASSANWWSGWRERIRVGVMTGSWEPVHGELINSGGDGRLVQPSTVTPPGVRIEGYWRRRSVHTRFRQASFQSGMRSMTIIVMLEID